MYIDDKNQLAWENFPYIVKDIHDETKKKPEKPITEGDLIMMLVGGSDVTVAVTAIRKVKQLQPALQGMTWLYDNGWDVVKKVDKNLDQSLNKLSESKSKIKKSIAFIGAIIKVVVFPTK